MRLVQDEFRKTRRLVKRHRVADLIRCSDSRKLYKDLPNVNLHSNFNLNRFDQRRKLDELIGPKLTYVPPTFEMMLGTPQATAVR